jgi:hypothetical protein
MTEINDTGITNQLNPKQANEKIGLRKNIPG